METYLLIIERTEDNGQTWTVQELRLKGYRAALATAKAIAGSGNGSVILRNVSTGRGRAIGGAQ